MSKAGGNRILSLKCGSGHIDKALGIMLECAENVVTNGFLPWCTWIISVVGNSGSPQKKYGKKFVWIEVLEKIWHVIFKKMSNFWSI